MQLVNNLICNPAWFKQTVQFVISSNKCLCIVWIYVIWFATPRHKPSRSINKTVCSTIIQDYFNINAFVAIHTNATIYYAFVIFSPPLPRFCIIYNNSKYFIFFLVHWLYIRSVQKYNKNNIKDHNKSIKGMYK